MTDLKKKVQEDSEELSKEAKANELRDLEVKNVVIRVKNV